MKSKHLESSMIVKQLHTVKMDTIAPHTSLLKMNFTPRLAEAGNQSDLKANSIDGC